MKKDQSDILHACKKFYIGQRVCHKTEGIGHIEKIDLNYPATVDVRWVTPNNEPSVLTSCVMDAKDLTPVGENVVPIQKSAEWWSKANDFYSGVNRILTDIIEEEE